MLGYNNSSKFDLFCLRCLACGRSFEKFQRRGVKHHSILVAGGSENLDSEQAKSFIRKFKQLNGE